MRTSSELVGFVGGVETTVTVESWTPADVHSFGHRLDRCKQPVPVVLCVNGARVVVEAGQLEASLEAAVNSYFLRICSTQG